MSLRSLPPDSRWYKAPSYSIRHGLLIENPIINPIEVRQLLFTIQAFTPLFHFYDESSSPGADDPPSISSARQVPPSVFIIHHDTSAFGTIASARQVT